MTWKYKRNVRFFVYMFSGISVYLLVSRFNISNVVVILHIQFVFIRESNVRKRINREDVR